jgi:hypothetical protein
MRSEYIRPQVSKLGSLYSLTKDNSRNRYDDDLTPAVENPDMTLM